MGLIVKLQNEEGVPLDVVEDRHNVLYRVLSGIEDAEFQWASTIDFYGDTMFNYLQAPRLRAEWRRILETCEDPDARQLLMRIDALVERCSSGVHLYVRFYGD